MILLPALTTNDFLAASLLSIGHDSDLIDRIQVQERHIRELARQLQDAQAVQL